VYPALVARQALGKDADPVLWVGSEGGMEAGLVQRAGLPYAEIPAGQVAGMGIRTPANLLKVIQGTLASRRILKDFKPDVLLFTGGFVAVPMALAGSGLFGARLLSRRIPSLVYVPDIEPGLALKVLARFASVIALTTEDSRKYFSQKARAVVTGYPTRPELTGWTRERAIEHLGLQPGHLNLLVFGGSSGARSINRALVSILPRLLTEDADMQIIHLTGKLDWEEVDAARNALPAELALRYKPMDYLHEMGAALAAADLVVSRAGASALGEFPLFGLPAILVPYPYAWRYQKVNADYLTERGAALLLQDEKLSTGLLPVLQSLSHDPERLAKMRSAMQSLARPEAAEAIAGLIRELAGAGLVREMVRERVGQHQNPGEKKHG
jgi:undecaprenyldiphospho-muramoylpentapeptide beta-N-acetylglucosaminyltransferase